MFLKDDGITPPLRKTGAIGARYIGWWFVPGHCQHTVIMEIYEDNSGR